MKLFLDIQTRTLTTWWNHCLAGSREERVAEGSLIRDLSSGVRLCLVAQRITGRAVQVKRAPKIHTQRADNCLRALEALRASGIAQTHHIYGYDIEEGSLMVILGLLKAMARDLVCQKYVWRADEPLSDLVERVIP